MEASNFKTHHPLKEAISVEHSTEVNSRRLGSFFDLLIQIDKRNHPELYEHKKSGTSSDQTAKLPDDVCLPGD